MTILQAIILGIVQGLTEFIPVSSSAHLVLVPYLLNWQLDPNISFVFDVLVQMGTLLAVIVYFWKDLLQVINGFVRSLLAGHPFDTSEARLGWFIILATIPAGLAGLLVKNLVEAAFNSPEVTAVFLLVTAALLFSSEKVGKRNRSMANFFWLDALVIGLLQAVAIFPGVSRSGSTISAGLFRNLDRRSAARFSFLISIPIMLAAGLLASIDLLHTPDFKSMLPLILVGFIAAAIVGYLSIRWLLEYLQKGSLTVFAIYCVVLSGVTLLTVFLR